jgi:hypothetical protein
MIRKTLVITLGTLSLFTGCATTYHPNFFSGGYSESRLGPNVALVSFNGNGFTSNLQVEKMALLRSADVTTQNGYRYFVITGSEDDSTNTGFVTPSYANTNFGAGWANTTFTAGQYIPIHKPAVSYMIHMGNNQGELAGFMRQIYDATFLQASLRTLR